MSDETIINRIPETAGQAYERVRLESETVQQNTEILEAVIATPEPDAVEASEDESITVEKIAEQVLTPWNTPWGGQTKTVWDTPEGQKAIDAVIEKAAVELGIAPVTISGLQVPEFETFKKQVIAAFKHLGLDTVKFFS